MSVEPIFPSDEHIIPLRNIRSILGHVAVGDIKGPLYDMLFLLSQNSSIEGLSRVSGATRLLAAKIPVHYESAIVMIDPAITRTSRNRNLGWEGCSEVPGMAGEIRRPDTIVVKYMDITGRKREKTFGGSGNDGQELARTLEHEIDHLDGGDFTDKGRDLIQVVPAYELAKFNL